MSIRFECFGMTILRARAIDLKMGGDEYETGGALVLDLPNDGKITLFMPYETCAEYANALNDCNIREAIDANENANTDR